MVGSDGAGASNVSINMDSIEDGMNAVFATPIWCKQWPDTAQVNAGLEAIIREKMAESAGVNLSNIGGWHSDGNLLKWSSAAIDALSAWINKGCQEMVAQSRNPNFNLAIKTSIGCWANVSGEGAYNAMHNHTPALLSGVYYVDPGTPSEAAPRSGLIEFMDPRVLSGPVPSRAFYPAVTMQPKAGMMLIFPGWLMHFVHPYQGLGERISIAFNLRVKSYDLNTSEEDA